MIGTRERLSFAAGDLGFNFVWQSIELYLLYFYVRVIGLSPEAASAIFLAGALIDWLIDPLIGVLVDRAASRGLDARLGTGRRIGGGRGARRRVRPAAAAGGLDARVRARHPPHPARHLQPRQHPLRRVDHAHLERPR